MSRGQTESWLALLELGRRFTTGWTLVGGQLVHLHCRERGANPARPTDDGDAVLDVRAYPAIHYEFTRALVDMGFTPESASAFGIQHRWVREAAIIDVLIPRHLGERAASRPGAGGVRTIATPGAQGALERSESVMVRVAGESGVIPRPTLVGAIAAKAAALEIVNDPGWKRHIHDLTVLATLVRRSDDFDSYTARDVARVHNAIGRTVVDPSSIALVDGAAEGLERLKLALTALERRRSTPS